MATVLTPSPVVLESNTYGSMELTIDRDVVAARFVGEFIKSVSELYSAVTQDELYIGAIEPGSIRIKFFALRKFLSKFSAALGRIAIKHAKNAEQTLDGITDAIIYRVIDEREKTKSEIHRNNLASTQTEMALKREILHGAPHFAKEMVELHRLVKPSTNEESCTNVAVKALEMYLTVMDPGDQLGLFNSDTQMDARESISNSLTVQYEERPPHED